MDYDVFISCKSEDYVYAEEVYDFLKVNGFNVFLASKELRQMGESEYRKSISKALKSAYHLIVFASKAEYIESKWVEYEWDTFLSVKLNGFKDGQIMTILKGVDIHDIPFELLKYQSFSFNNYKDNILSYVETDDYLARMEEYKKRAQEIEEEQKKKNQIEKENKKIKEELIVLAKEYSTKVSALSIDIKEIDAKMRSIGITYRICPVCKTKVELSQKYCSSCGWTISPILGIEGDEYLINDKQEQMNIVKSVWEKVDNSSLEKTIQNLQTALEDTKTKLQRTEEIIKNKNAEITAIKKDLVAKDEELSTLKSKFPTETVSSIIKKYDLESVLPINDVNRLMLFIRKFCTNGYTVGCSGLYAGLKIEELKQALKIIYNIDMPDYDGKTSVWSFAEKLWTKNSCLFLIR